MKAFGIRLAFGAATILCGAYAAALAQRDHGDGELPPVAEGEPLAVAAEPVAGWEPTLAPAEDAGTSNGAMDDWLAAVPAAGAGEPVPMPEPAAGVRLVGHDEMNADVDPRAMNADMTSPAMGLPASLAGGSDEPVEMGAAGFELPPFDNPAEAAASSAPEASFAGEFVTGPGFDVPAATMDAPLPNGPPIADRTPALPNFDPAASGFDSPASNVADSRTASLGDAPAGLLPEPSAMPADAYSAMEPNGAPMDSNLPVNPMRGGGPMADPTMSMADPAAPVTAGPTPLLTPADGRTFATAPTLGGYPGPDEPSMRRTMEPADLPNAASVSSGPVGPSGSVGLSQPSGYDAAATRSVRTPVAGAEVDPQTLLDSPGERRLEGVQTPAVVIHKRAPEIVKVGRAAPFVIEVQNVGSVDALDVRVHDRVPAGMTMADATPPPVTRGDVLLWELGTLTAGETRTITTQMIPRAEGELGSVARVSFEAAASVRTTATRPELKVVQRAPERVMIGGQVEIELEVSNPGTGVAAGVTLQENVPDGFEHPRGRELDNFLGDLQPGEIRRQMLRMRAVAPGMVRNVIRLIDEDGLSTEDAVEVQVVAPEIRLALAGPQRRFLERPAVYNLDVANTGTAEATNVQIAVQLDRGVTFVSTENQGYYDQASHSVRYNLPVLPAGESGSVPLTLLPVAQGDHVLTARADADLQMSAETEHRVSVEAFAELDFAIRNPGGPVEVGAQTSFEIEVTNSGSADDGNVQIQLQLPPGLELIDAEGDSQTDGRGLVAFAPITSLSPGQSVTRRATVRGTAAGTHLARAVVVSRGLTTPVTKEESTLVYADR